MAEPVARPEGYARKPGEGPETSTDEITRRQAAKLNASKNGELVDGVTRPYLTPRQSKT